MATTSQPVLPEASEDIEYPTGDGQPMAETPTHRDNMTDTIAVLRRRYAGRDVYVSGNMFVYYVPGNRLRHLAPDVFAVFGVPDRRRDCYKTWEEPKPTLDWVAEFTSRSTKEEDLEDKFWIYRDEVGVKEYLLFDPYEEYLDPPQRLYRLRGGEYEPVEPVDGRLPSEVLGLHIDRDGPWMRLYDPESGLWLPTPAEIEAQHQQTLQQLESLRGELGRAAEQRDQLASGLESAEAEIERLKNELDQLRAGRDGDSVHDGT